MQALIADDSEIQRVQISEWLGSLGYECHTAIDGKEAFGLLTKNTYNIIVLDNAMPMMTGIELAKAYYKVTLERLSQQGAIKQSECKNLLNLDNYKDSNFFNRSKGIIRIHFPPIIMLTAEPLRIDKELAAYLGINYWIIKPIGYNAFKTLIESIRGSL